ncbi:hypothetical protein [Bradyrhizobium sp. Tv2a-2]|uniref:hypothetical protein n=1 Tax=Bradyrhizobium sp. Tv2a-2 TaxID=113395 RepID=UPI0004089BE4|nr:hypothetical protein [Bradyrhizobium sp. Tv2a-2]
MTEALTADEALIADIMRAELHDRFHGKRVTRQEVAEVVAGLLAMDPEDIDVAYVAQTGQFFIDIRTHSP